MEISGYTMFWDAAWDYSGLTDKKLEAAIQDAREVFHGILLEDDPNPVDKAEQSALLRALLDERGKRQDPPS